MTLLSFESYKKRNLSAGDSIYVYRNLNAQTLSIRKGNLVHGHSTLVVLTNVSFLVNKNGNERTRKLNQRNVHAFVKGTLYASEKVLEDVEQRYQSLESKGYSRIYYNPHKVESFVYYDSQKPVFQAEEAIVVMDRIYIK